MDLILHLSILVVIHSILAMSLNYVAGYAGILSLSHATFYGVGAYSTAILTTRYDFGFLSSVGIGILAAGLLAFLASFPILKLKKDSLVLVSFGFAIIMYNVMLNWQGLTKGPLGIKGVGKPEIFGFAFSDKLHFLLLVFAFALLVYFILRRIIRSPYAVILKGVRENETVSASSGHEVKSYQRSAFVFGALFAALAGSFTATFLTFIEPKLFELTPSMLILIMIIIGGMASLKGSILGAALLILLPELLRYAGFIPNQYLAETQQILYGLALILVLLLRPQGILGRYKL